MYTCLQLVILIARQFGSEVLGVRLFKHVTLYVLINTYK
jgi:hypothetical protein